MPVESIVVTQKHIYSGSWDKRILRYNRQTLELDSNFFLLDQESIIQDFYSHTDSIKSLMIFKDFLYSGSADGIVSKWDINKEGEQHPLTTQQLSNRFITSLVSFGDNILIGCSNKQIFIVDQQLNILKSSKLEDISTINKIYVQPSGIYVSGRDIFQLNFDLELEKIFLLKNEPEGLLFSQDCILAATRAGCFKIPYGSWKKADYYKNLQKDADKITIDQMRQIRDIENKKKDEYQELPIGITDIPCGLNIVAQNIKFDEKQRKCYMILTGCYDGSVKRVFYKEEDRQYFFPKNVEDSEESLGIDMNDSSDLSDDDEQNHTEIKTVQNDKGYDELQKMLNNQQFKPNLN